MLSLLRDSDSPRTLCLQHVPSTATWYYHFKSLAANSFGALSMESAIKALLFSLFLIFLRLFLPLHLVRSQQDSVALAFLIK